MDHTSSQPADADPLAKVISWIAGNVRGKTFADIGGIGVDSINERITQAVGAKAASATMIDIRPRTYYEWKVFHAKCRKAGLMETDYACMDAVDINDPALKERVGTFDFVHSTGINYHLPSPVLGMHNLRQIVDEYLITNTVIVPEIIKTPKGTLTIPGSQALFMPGLSEHEREILDWYYRDKFNMTLDYMAPRLNAPKPDCPWYENGSPTCWPYWWLLTIPAFEGLVRVVGFEILDSALWENHAYSVLCRPIRRG